MDEQPPPVSSASPPPSKPPKISSLAILGTILMVILLMLLYGLFFPLGRPAGPHVLQAVCLSNVKQISLACAIYADTNNGRLPQELDSLTNILTSTKVFVCPSAKDQTHYSYAFTGAANLWQSNPDVIMLREIETNHFGKRTLLYNDGHVEQRKD